MTTNEIDFQFIPNREVREIPHGWQHPKDARGKHIPLLPADYTFDDAEHAAGAAGLMPTPGAGAMIAAYETTTEGTPISPAFPNTPEGRRALVAYCTEHAFVFGHRRAGVEAWAAVLFGEGASVDSDGTVRA